MSEDETIDIRREVEARKKIEVEKFNDGTGSDSGNNGFTSKFVLECFRANEMGDGILYAELNKNKFLYNAFSKMWMCWTNHYWENDELDTSIAAVEEITRLYIIEAKKLVDDIANAASEQTKQYYKDLQKNLYSRISKLRAHYRRKNVLQFARSNNINSLAIKGDQFNLNPWVLACKNGVIDLRTGKLNSGRPNDYISKAAPIEWNGIDEPAPIWEMFLNDIFEGNISLIEYVGRLLGYAITGLNIEHIFPILSGQGRNGKGTLINTLIKYVLGPLAAPIQAEMLLSQKYPRNAAAPSPDIMTLYGLRIAFASETDEGRYINASKIKWLTGDDILTGRNPNDKFSTNFIPTHTLILSTNNMPNAPSDDFAFWERVHLIPFNLSFVNREPVKDNERRADQNLPDRLKDEASGILAWLVRGCLQWQKFGLDPPPIVLEATHKYQRRQDILGDFIDECLIEDPLAETPANILYDAFKKWWEENMSKTPWSIKKFGHAMTKRYKKEKHGHYIYYGITLNSFGQ